jgi:hypothetical protein
MDENLSRQILDDLLPSLEALDTKTTALLQLLKDKGIAAPEEMTAYLDQAANASNVRWRAARVRLDYLLSSAAKPPDQAAEKKDQAAEKKSSQPAENREPVSGASGENEEKEDQGKKNSAVAGTDKTPAADQTTATPAGAKKEKTSPEPTAEKANANADNGDSTTAAA